jgi:8-oxo-dGTP diphosphatase
MRETKKSVTCFLQHGDEYLFVHRTKKGNDTDANRLNGIGGKLEKGENFLQAAIRETAEETGYLVVEKDCYLAGVVSLEGGYAQDWDICFFVISVDSKDIPLGSSNAEGELLWLHKDSVLNSDYELVDDLHYLWQKIIARSSVFFAGTILDENEKVAKISISEIPN